jgi:zinc protease
MLALSACMTGLPARGTVVMREVSIPLRDFRLPSGLRVVVEEDRRSPVVAVVAVVGAGSSHDPAGKEGLAHMAEHLSFRARHQGGPSVRTRLEQLEAGRFGAVTRLDHTVYMTLAPRETLQALLKLEAQRLAAPLEGVTGQIFSVEREVLRNELRQLNETGFSGQVFHWVQEASFPAEHPYSRPLLGNDDSLFRVTLADTHRFVRNHYQPENVTLVISGDVDLVAMEALLKESLPKAWYGEGPPLAVAPRLSAQAPALPEVSNPTKLVSRKAAVNGPELYLTWVLPRGFDEASAVHDFVRASLSSKLPGAWRIDGDIADIDTVLIPGTRASLLLVRATLYTGLDPERSAEAILDQVHQIWSTEGGAEDVLVAQLSFQRNQRTALIGMALESEDLLARARRRAEFTHFLLDARAYRRFEGALASLDGAKVVEFAYRWLQRHRARVLLVEPEKNGVPILASVMGLPPDDVVAPPRGPQPPVNPVSAPVTSLRLDNGLEVLLAVRPGLPLVSIGVALGGGASSGKPGVAEVADQVSFRTSEFKGLHADYGLHGQRNLYSDHLRYTLAGASGNVGNMLAILQEEMSSLGTIAEVMRYYTEAVLPLRQEADTHPEVQAYRVLNHALYGDHPYGHVATGEDVAKVTQSAVEDWLSRVHRPSNAVMVIAGEFDPQEVMPLVHRYLGGWSGTGKLEVPPVPALTKPGTRPAPLVTPVPEAVQGRLQLACRLPSASPEAGARYELMAAVLRARLWYQVRERMGATYGFYTAVQAHHGGAVHLLMEDVVDAEQLGVSLSGVRKVLEEYAREGVPAAELESARARLLAAHATTLITSAAWVDALLDARVRGWSTEAVTGKPALLQAVTSTEVQKDFAGCLEQLVVGIIGDEAKARTAVQAAFP